MRRSNLLCLVSLAFRRSQMSDFVRCLRSTLLACGLCGIPALAQTAETDQRLPELGTETPPAEQSAVEGPSAAELEKIAWKTLTLDLVDGISRAGGGSLPLLDLPTQCVRVRAAGRAALEVAREEAREIVGAEIDDPFGSQAVDGAQEYVKAKACITSHRIQVQVQSTWFPLFDINPQRYVENIFKATEDDFVKATHRVYHSAAQPSRLEVRVLPD